MTEPGHEQYRLRHETGSEQGQVLRLPAHGSPNAIPPAWVVEENPFLDGAGAHLPIFAQMDRRSCEPVRLTAGVQPVHVRFVLVRTDMRIEKRRVHESKHRTQKQ